MWSSRTLFYKNLYKKHMTLLLIEVLNTGMFFVLLAATVGRRQRGAQSRRRGPTRNEWWWWWLRTDPDLSCFLTLPGIKLI